MTDTEREALTQRIDELCQEVEQLRKQLHDQQDTAEHNFVRNAREYKRVCDENAKLQELARDMMWTIRHTHGYFKNDTHEMLMTYVRGRDGKPTHVAHSLTCDEEEYERRMQALGIEVPE